MIINLTVMIFVALTKLEEIEARLEGSSVVNNNKMSGSGLIAKVLRLGQISGLLCANESFLNSCEPNALENIARFPAGLRRWVNLPFHAATFFIISLVGMWSWGKFAGFY